MSFMNQKCSCGELIDLRGFLLEAASVDVHTGYVNCRCGISNRVDLVPFRAPAKDVPLTEGPTLLQAGAPLRFALNFTDFSNQDMRALAEQLIRKYAHLIPHWVRFLEVRDSGTLDGGICEAWSRPRYHTAGIRLTGQWFSYDPEYRELAIVHELLHIADGRRHSFFHDRVLDMAKAKAEDAAIYFEKDYEEIMEDFTQHMAIAISGVHPAVPQMLRRPGPEHPAKDMMEAYLRGDRPR